MIVMPFIAIPVILWLLCWAFGINDKDGAQYVCGAFGAITTFVFVMCLFLCPVKMVDTETMHDQFKYAQNGAVTSVVLNDGTTFTSDKAWFYNQIQDSKSYIIHRVGYDDVGISVSSEYLVSTK